MFEYSISDGEGTLLDYGMTDRMEIVNEQEFALDFDRTMIFGPAGADCTTGE